MADKEKKDENRLTFAKLAVANRHKVLSDIETQTRGTEITDVFEVAGHRYLMSTLTADEETWADSYTNATNPVVIISSMKLPALAASIRAIDDVKIDELFTFPEDITEFDKQFHSQDQYHKRYWLMSQMLLWLGPKPQLMINELWRHYVTLIDRRDKSWDELKKSFARIPGGESKASSLPERESSPATQTSNG
jgi:hypothetical protein